MTFNPFQHPAQPLLAPVNRGKRSASWKKKTSAVAVMVAAVGFVLLSLASGEVLALTKGSVNTRPRAVQNLLSSRHANIVRRDPSQDSTALFRSRGGSRPITMVAAEEDDKVNFNDDVIETQLAQAEIFTASEEFKKNTKLSETLYDEAKEDRLKFWETQASKLDWFEPWKETLRWNRPYAEWFVGGKLNAAHNCLDVHLKENGDKQAIIWEGENGSVVKYTYQELYHEVNKMASKLVTEFGVKKGDRVIIYMPMVPELVIATLACARIGAIHSVVFGGFSSEALKDRIDITKPQCVLTADGGYRRGKVVPLKSMVDEALAKSETNVPHVMVVQSLEAKDSKVNMVAGRDVFHKELVADAPNEWPAAKMDAEDPLFILFSSGTTGKPKGILHTTGGYMTHAKYSTKTVFDLQDDDVYWCTADVGWITGHTYLVYGPLANAATVVMFEGTPDYPAQDRFWQIIEDHKVSVFYTAPTAVRAFMKWGTEHVEKHDLSSLRILGSVGEPINPEAWKWYHKHIGGGKCPIVDTWWQTETGGIMVSNVPAYNDMKPGYAGTPLPGIKVDVLSENGEPVEHGGGYLSVTEPWPSMLRGLWQDNERYEKTYWSRFNTYFAGDGAAKDDDGYFMVLGRVDDVLNVAGHRIGTMELESTIVGCEGVAEAAVVGMPDEIKFQAILAFVTLKEGEEPSQEKKKEIMSQVVKGIGAIARPKHIVFTPELPKTRSGKIMRRILKNLATGESVGETSTLANPDIVSSLEKSLQGEGVVVSSAGKK
mmetsp:Transcript_15677/g.25881  ORF Transcript_15677/g.25881 Transcript_15677/m.25881 type:complete len:770 (+) Transcript_15677:49-2358(+)